LDRKAETYTLEEREEFCRRRDILFIIGLRGDAIE
jgi:hypothetical protein